MTAHKHHWLIPKDAVDGAYHARCKGCGAKRTFPWQPQTKSAWGNAVNPTSKLRIVE